MLRKAVEQLQGTEYHPPANSSLAAKLGKYAELLAAEGSLQTALTYLTGSTQVSSIIWRVLAYNNVHGLFCELYCKIGV